MEDEDQPMMHRQSSPPKRSAAAAAETHSSITPPTEKKNEKPMKTKKVTVVNQKSIASFFAAGPKPVPRPAPAPAIIPTTAKPAEQPTVVKSTVSKVDATKEALRDIVVGVCAPISTSTMHKSSKPLPKDLPVPANIWSPLRATKKARIWGTALSQAVNDAGVDSNIHPEANVHLTMNQDDVKAAVHAVDDDDEVATVIMDTVDDEDDFDDDVTVGFPAVDDYNDEGALGVNNSIAELSEKEKTAKEEPIQEKTKKANNLFNTKHTSSTLKTTKKELPPEHINRVLAPENTSKEVTLNENQKEVAIENVVDNVAVVEMTEETPAKDPTKASEASPFCPERAALMVKNEQMRQKYMLKSYELIQRGKAGSEEESFEVPKADMPPLLESNDGSFPEGGVSILASLVQERYVSSGGG